MKKIISQIINGILICEFVLLVISIFMSYIFLDGGFTLANPDLIESSASVFSASLSSICLTGLLGIVFSLASLVWKEEKFSILKRTIIHFFLTAFTISFVGYKLFWFQRSLQSLSIFFATYFLIYLAIWFIEYTIYKRDISRLNAKIKNNI